MKLGIIGLSKGNGHPYSWAAIINGDFDAAAMEQCGFPVIPTYLKANTDTIGIDDAYVTHIWTQDRAISEHCAKSSKITHVCEKIEDMIGRVDAVLLARDDPENHVSMARPFIEAGVPIFIDKPLAITWDDLDYFSEQVRAGKFIMSCSSMRYAPGVQQSRVDVNAMKDIQLAVTVGKKDWIKYGIHYLEGMFAVLKDPVAVSARHISTGGRDIVYIEFENGMLATVHVFMDIAPGSDLTLYGGDKKVSVRYGGAYPSFRNTLTEAIHAFREGRPRLEFAKTENLIKTLIAGNESLKNGGKTIKIPQ